MGTYNLTGLAYWTSGIPNNVGWKEASSRIETGQGTVGEHSMTITRIDFIAPDFLNKNIKLTIQISGLANKTYRSAEYSSATLSKKEFKPTELVPYPESFSNNDISNALKENRIGTTVQGVLNGDVASFTLQDISLESKATYHLYFIRKDAPPIYNSTATSILGYTGLFQASDISISLQMEISQLDAPTITTAKKVLPYSKEGEIVTINWNAVSSKSDNTLKKYQVYLRVGSKPTVTNPGKILDVDATSTSYDLSLAGIARASKVYIGVQAISQYDDYKETYEDIFGNCNSSITTLYLGNINSLPSKPTLSKSSSTIGGNQSIVFSDFSSSDVDNQTITYYYSLNSTTKNKISNNSLSLTLDSLRNIGITETGTYEIKFYAYDTMDYSSANTVSFTAEFAPVITSRSASITTVEGGNSTSCLDTIILNYILQYPASDLTPLVYVHVGNNYSTKKTLDSKCYSISGKTITIKVANILTSQVAHGANFKVSFEIKNSGNLSSGTGDQLFGEYTRPVKLAASSITSRVTLKNDAKTHGTSWDNHFKNYISLELGTMPKASNRPIVDKITLITRDKNNILRTATLTESKENSLGMKNAIPNAGDWATLAVRVTDKAGQITETEVLGTYYRVGALNFPQSGNYTISRTLINPCITGQSFTITHPVAVNASNNEITVSYKYSYSINGSNIQFSTTKTSSSTNTTIEASTSNITELKEDILEVVDETANFNGVGTITITATDDFGQVATYSGLNLTTDTRTAPSFNGNTNFILRHNYDIGSNSTTQNDKAVPINSSYPHSEIFNSGEKIVFQIPKPTDPNKDISNINIYLSRTILPIDAVDIKAYDDEDLVYNLWQSIPITPNQLKDVDGDEVIDEQENIKTDYYYYTYTASSYLENEYFYFKITAVDTLGQTSETLINTQYIIGARTVPSQIEVTSKNTTIERDESSGKASVTLNFDVNVLDLGGSASRNNNNKVVWDQDYYNEYPNFDRTFYRWYNNEYGIVNIKGWKKVKVEISSAADFSSDYLTTEGRREDPNGEWTFTIDGFDPNVSRVYVRVTLYIPYALKNAASSINRTYITGTPAIYSYFETVPTVAYRPHQLGINTKNMTEGSVLEIAPYSNNEKNYSKIIIRRDINTSIVIDLDSQSITGLTIEGGSW